jgi:diguanylate cyclase (GGDEF)-like protein/PAS domain S-box-containing protein
MDFKAHRVLDLSPDIIAALDWNGRIVYANPSFARLTGHIELLGRDFSDFLSSADRAIASARLTEAQSQNATIRFDARMNGSGSRPSRLSWTIRPDHEARLLYAIGHVQQPRFQDEELLRTALEESPCAMLVADRNGLLTQVNRVMEQLFGYAPGELIGQPVEVLVPEQLREQHVAQREGFSADSGMRPMGKGRDLMGRRQDGAIFPVEIGLSPVTTSRGEYVIGAVVDLSDRKATEERIASQAQELEQVNARLAQMASTDSLTKLWNRRSFIDQLGIQLEMSLRNSRPLSVLILDIDHFKPYNDNYGHLAGDAVLQQVARILRGKARRSDYVARLGGEEFGIISPETARQGAVRVGERFRGAIEAARWPLRPVTASIGATTVHHAPGEWRAEPSSYSNILAQADKALYYSKEHGRNRVTHVHDVKNRR